MCCANIKLLLANGDPLPDQERNALDAREGGAQAMVCLCPVCVEAWRRLPARTNCLGSFWATSPA